MGMAIVGGRRAPASASPPNTRHEGQSLHPPQAGQPKQRAHPARTSETGDPAPLGNRTPRGISRGETS
jgi:hypothetical protein